MVVCLPEKLTVPPPGMLQSRTFHIRMVGTQAARTVSYAGTETVVDMR